MDRPDIDQMDVAAARRILRQYRREQARKAAVVGAVGTPIALAMLAVSAVNVQPASAVVGVDSPRPGAGGRTEQPVVSGPVTGRVEFELSAPPSTVPPGAGGPVAGGVAVRPPAVQRPDPVAGGPIDRAWLAQWRDARWAVERYTSTPEPEPEAKD